MQEKPADPADYFKNASTIWADLLAMMAGKPYAMTAVGPMRNFVSNTKKITDELIDSNRQIIEFNNHLLEYYKQLTKTWTDAQSKVNSKFHEIPKDSEQFEAYKRVWIDIFENDFTQLFDSDSFGKNYGKLVTTELELAKRYNKMLDILLKSAHMPTKDEIDEIYRELHTMRKRLSKLERDSKNDSRK